MASITPKYSLESETSHVLSPEVMAAFERNTAEQIKRIKGTALTPPTLTPKLCLLLDNVLSEEECQQLIDASERLGYGVAMLNVGMGRQEHAPGYRDSSRVMADDVELADLILRRIQHFVPESFHGYPRECLNERLRFLRYDPGDRFQAHFDGCFSREGQCSMVTLQIYLNGGFEGGATTFLAAHGMDDVAVVPKPGRILVFEHRILHEGSKLVSGRKYTIRTDVMYGTKKQL